MISYHILSAIANCILILYNTHYQDNNKKILVGHSQPILKNLTDYKQNKTQYIKSASNQDYKRTKNTYI